jgi:hypothetical protein
LILNHQRRLDQQKRVAERTMWRLKSDLIVLQASPEHRLGISVAEIARSSARLDEGAMVNAVLEAIRLYLEDATITAKLSTLTDKQPD